MKNSTVVGQNGIQCNADYGGGLKEEVHLHIHRSTVMANNASGYAILSNASDLKVEHSYVVGSDATKVLVIGENLPKVGDVIAKLSFSEFYNAQITFDTRQIVGTKLLKSSSCIYSGYVFPDAPPTFSAETQAKSLKYENNYADPFNSGTLAVPAPQQLSAEDVQDAIDELTLLSTILGAFGVMNSLDVAYDGIVAGPIAGSGDGRKISADQGAVVIQSASTPYTTTPISGTETTPLTSGDKNGYLQIEGNLEVGKIDSAEMELISNYGTIGSMLSMGSVTWNSEIASVASGTDHRSLPSAIIQGNSDKDSLLHNYNVRVQTKSTKNVSNGSVGWVILQGGDSLDKGPSAPGPHAGDVYIQGGSYLGSSSPSVGDNCPAGSVHLIPGTSTGIGSDEPYGYVKLINPTASTSASLLASGACSNPTTCAGDISWATPMGVVTATITIGMTITDVINAINNATVGAGLIFAQESAGLISLSCVSKGELSDVVYVGDTDSGNLNADLGDFQISSGAIFVAGTDPQYVTLHSSAMHEITIGEGGTVGPMIYNSDTGKLTVPGLIDPTGMIFSQTAHTNVPTTATEGAIFVSDGTDGLVANKIYYKPANNGTPVDLTAGGGGGAGLTFWTEDGSGNLYPNTTNTQDLGSITNSVKNLYVDTTGLTFTTGDGTTAITLNVPVPSTPTLEFQGDQLAYQSQVSANTTNITNLTADVATKIEYGDLSVTTNAASGNGALSYDNTNGTFTFTPADTSGGGGGGSGFTNWSEDGSQNLVTNSVDDIGSNTQHIGNIRQRSGKGLITYSSSNDKQWDVAYIDLASSGGTGNPIVANYYATNDVANVALNDGIQFNFQYNADVDGIILQPGSMRLVFSDLTSLTTDFSTAFEFWVADTVTNTKYLSIDGGANSIVFHKVPTLYKDTTVNLNAYSDLVDGMIAFDTTLNQIVYYISGTGWNILSGGGGGGLTGTGAVGTVGVFDGTGAINGGFGLTFNTAAHSLFVNSDDGAFGSFTHYSNSIDGADNWVVGRSHDGSLLLRTQSVYNATFNQSDYDTGWSIDTSGNFIPTGSGTLDIGSATNRVQSIYVDAVNSVHFLYEENSATVDKALSVDISFQDPQNANAIVPFLTFNGQNLSTTIQMNDTKVYIDDDNSGVVTDGRIYFHNNGQDTWYIDKSGNLNNNLNSDQTIGRLDNPLANVNTKKVFVHYDFTNTTNGSVQFESVNLASPDPTLNAFFSLDMNQTTKRLEFRGNQLAYNSEISASGISYTDLSVATNAASGNGSLSYNNTNGTFTFTPAVKDSITDGTTTLDFDGSNNLQLNGHFLPTDDITYDLGSSSLRWRALYLDGSTIYLGDTPISLNATDPADKHLEIDGTRLPTKFEHLADVDGARTATTGHVLKRKADGRFAFEAETAGSATNRIEDGDSSFRIADPGTGALATLKIDNVNRLHLTSSTMYPQTTDTYNLGTSTKTFAQVHTKEIELYENGSSTPSGTLTASASDTIGTDAQVFVTKDHRHTQQANHTTAQSEYRGIAERTVRTGNQSRIIHNTDVNTWKTNATDNARNGTIVPMFALATERVKTLSVQKGIWSKADSSTRADTFYRETELEPGTFIRDYQTLPWPEYNLVDYPNIAEEAFGWTTPTKQNSAECKYYGQLLRSGAINTLQFQEFLSENVRGFGHSHLFNAESATGSSVLSFLVKMKGITRIEISIIASKCTYSGGNNQWRTEQIASETFNFAGTQVTSGFEGVIMVDQEQPVRLTDVSARYGQVTIEIKIHLRDQSAGEGAFLQRTEDFFTYSDLRLNLFSS